VNDPILEAIADRVRSLVASEPTKALDALAQCLRVHRDALQELIEHRERLINPALLIDIVAVLTREFGVDPQWLLTGRYDPSIHRRSLVLGEDRSSNGARAVQQFVREQYRQLLESSGFRTPSEAKTPNE
jgi:plasmid maintenance system antidote protein VapI